MLEEKNPAKMRSEGVKKSWTDCDGEKKSRSGEKPLQHGKLVVQWNPIERRMQIVRQLPFKPQKWGMYSIGRDSSAPTDMKKGVNGIANPSYISRPLGVREWVWEHGLIAPEDQRR